MDEKFNRSWRQVVLVARAPSKDEVLSTFKAQLANISDADWKRMWRAWWANENETIEFRHELPIDDDENVIYRLRLDILMTTDR